MKTGHPRRHCRKYQSLERAYYDCLDMPCVQCCRKENTGNQSYGVEDNEKVRTLSVTAWSANIFLQRQRIRCCRHMLAERWTGQHVTGYFTSDYCLNKHTERVWISNWNAKVLNYLYSIMWRHKLWRKLVIFLNKMLKMNTKMHS